MSKIGYQMLSPAEKIAYQRFEKAFEFYSPAADFTGIDPSVNTTKVLGVALDDHPEVIYFNKSSIRTQTSSWGTQVLFDSAKFPLQAIAKQKQLNQALDKAIREIEWRNPLSDYDKLICIYEYIQDHVTYDHKELERISRGGDGMMEAHNAYGAMVNQLAVCDGIAGAFALLAQRMGFECSVISGTSLLHGPSSIGHSWNIIKLAGHYYHLDVTWDMSYKKSIGQYSYMYFCVNDDLIGTDHTWDISIAPFCSHDEYSFFKRNRCVANNLTQMSEIFTRIARSKQSVVHVRLEEGFPVPDPQDQYLLQKWLDAVSAARGGSSVSCIWSSTARCFIGIIK